MQVLKFHVISASYLKNLFHTRNLSYINSKQTKFSSKKKPFQCIVIQELKAAVQYLWVGSGESSVI